MPTLLQPKKSFDNYIRYVEVKKGKTVHIFIVVVLPSKNKARPFKIVTVFFVNYIALQ
jgi:hypothetical protein